MALAITNDNVPVEVDVMIGKPDPQDVKDALSVGEAIVYVETQPGAVQMSEYASFNRYRTIYPTVSLTATAVNRVLTFGGQPQAGLNVHLLGGWPTADGYYRTQESDTTLGAIASNIGVACAAAGLSNTVVDNVVTFTTPIRCNVGGTGSLVRESSRIRQRFKAIVLARSADDEVSPELGLRSAIGHAILSQIGSLETDNLPLDDGTIEIIRSRDNWFVDRSQSAFGIAEYHLLYEIQYGILEITPATQVGSMSSEFTNPAGAVIGTRIDG